MPKWIPRTRTLTQRLEQELTQVEVEKQLSPVAPVEEPEIAPTVFRPTIGGVRTPLRSPPRLQVTQPAFTETIRPRVAAPIAPIIPRRLPAEAAERPVGATLPDVEPPIVAQPFWKRAIAAFGAPFEWFQSNVLNPAISVGADVLIPDLVRKANESYLAWKERSRESWQAPGVDIPVPWGDGNWRIDLKGIVEFAPWLLVPGVGQLGTTLVGAARAVATFGQVGRAVGLVSALGRGAPFAAAAVRASAPMVRTVGYALKYSPFAGVEKVAAVAIGKPLGALFKGFDSASQAVGRKIFGQYVGRDAPPAVQDITRFLRESVKPLFAGKDKAIGELRKRQAARLQALRELPPTPETGRAIALARKGGADIPTVPADEIATLRPETFGELDEILKTSTLTVNEWANARESLESLIFGRLENPIGTLPIKRDLIRMGRVFGPDFQEVVSSIIAKPRGRLETFIDVANVPRAIMASWDFSATLRQGMILGIMRPNQVPRAFFKSLKAFASEKLGLEMDDLMRADPDFVRAVTKQVDFTDFRVGAKIAAREESFASSYVQRIPGVRPSERAYITYLNQMRLGAFKSAAPVWEALGASDADLNGLGQFINAASGRGNVPRALKGKNILPFLNTIFFSPRLQLSRLQLPLMLGSKNPYVRREAARGIVTFMGAVGSLLGLLHVTGVGTVETDPRSADFGKLKVGDTRFDIWTGYAQYSRFIAQMLTGERKSAFGNMSEVERLQTVARFTQSKTAPAIGLFLDLLRGETYLGEEIVGETADLPRQVQNRLFPLFIQDMLDAFETGGTNTLFAAGPAAILGIGVLTYTNEFARAKDKAARKAGKDTWEELDPITQRRLENTDTELQAAFIAHDRQVMGTQWGDYNLTGKTVESMFTDMVLNASNQHAETQDGFLFREKVDTALKARRGAYATRQSDPRFSELVERMDQPRPQDQLASLGPEQVAIKLYQDAMYGDDMYDEFGDYRFDLARERKAQLKIELGDELFAFVEEFRGLKTDHLPEIYQQLQRAKIVMRPYWDVTKQVEDMLGVPKTIGQQRRFDRLVSRLRKTLRRNNSEIDKAFTTFYSRQGQVFNR